jgi:hypothetical protein
MFSYRVMGSEAQELPYRLEMWDDRDTRFEELIALVADHAVARAAFAEAVRRRPDRLSFFDRNRECSPIAEVKDATLK